MSGWGDDRSQAAIRGIAVLRQAGWPDAEIYAMPTEQIVSYGRGATLPQRVGNVTGGEQLNAASQMANTAATAGLGRGNLAATMATQAFDRAKYRTELGRDPFSIVAYEHATGESGVPNALMGSGALKTYANPDAANFAGDDPFTKYASDYLQYPNSTEAEIRRGGAAGANPDQVDAVNAAYARDPAAAKTFFSQNPDDLAKMFPAHAGGGTEVLHGPITAFDERGNPVFTAAENGDERAHFGAGGRIRFKPMLGVSRTANPARDASIVAQTQAAVAAHTHPGLGVSANAAGGDVAVGGGAGVDTGGVRYSSSDPNETVGQVQAGMAQPKTPQATNVVTGGPKTTQHDRDQAAQFGQNVTDYANTHGGDMGVGPMGDLSKVYRDYEATHPGESGSGYDLRQAQARAAAAPAPAAPQLGVPAPVGGDITAHPPFQPTLPAGPLPTAVTGPERSPTGTWPAVPPHTHLPTEITPTAAPTSGGDSGQVTTGPWVPPATAYQPRAGGLGAVAGGVAKGVGDSTPAMTLNATPALGAPPAPTGLGEGAAATPPSAAAASPDQQKSAQAIAEALANETTVDPRFLNMLKAGSIPPLSMMTPQTWAAIPGPQKKALQSLWVSTGLVSAPTDIDESLAATQAKQPLSRYQYGDTSTF